MNKIILGIDPGTASTGWGIVKANGHEYKIKKYGVIRTSQHLNLAERLNLIYDELTDILKKERLDEAAVEELFFFKNAKTAIAVGHARGVILLACQKANMPIYEYTPLQVKQALVGYGRADKNQIQQMLKAILRLDKIPKPDDAADALAVAITHINNNAKVKNQNAK